jgi:hypothetical protein
VLGLGGNVNVNTARSHVLLALAWELTGCLVVR